MPYADPHRRREANAENQRRYRARQREERAALQAEVELLRDEWAVILVGTNKPSPERARVLMAMFDARRWSPAPEKFRDEADRLRVLMHQALERFGCFQAEGAAPFARPMAKPDAP